MKSKTTHNIILIVLICFTSWSCKKNDPVANFSFNAAYTYAPVKLTFQNLSSDATEFSWSFCDGNTSIDENPENEFITGGQYTVTLVAKNSKKKSNLMSKEFVVLPAPRYCLVESILLEDRKNLSTNKQYVIKLNKIESIPTSLPASQELFVFNTPVQMDVNDIGRKIELCEYLVTFPSQQPPLITITTIDNKDFKVLNDFAKPGTTEQFPKKINLKTANDFSLVVNLKWF